MCRLPHSAQRDSRQSIVKLCQIVSRIDSTTAYAMLSPPAFHPTYAKLLHSILREAGVAIHTHQAQLGAKNEELFISQDEMQDLIGTALDAIPNPALGLAFGELAQVYMHGPVGYAAVASPNLRAALDVVVRYSSLRSHAMRFEWRDNGNEMAFCLIEQMDLGRARKFVLEALMVVIARLLSALSGEARLGLTFDFPWPQPAWVDEYTQRLGTGCRFDAVGWAIHLPRNTLDIPCITADNHAYATAIHAGEQQLLSASAANSVANQIRQYLNQRAAPYPSAADMARLLNLSNRSLLRKLQNEGVRYQTLLDEIRYANAKHLLLTTHDGVGLIAEQLGLGDSSNFSRLFKRWSSVTPTVFRRITKEMHIPYKD